MSETSRSPRPRDPEAAKARLLRAATDEFATYGVAGARIDRIGAAAGVNKAQIYTYFGNKEQLFDIVLGLHVTRIFDEVPFTAEDLPAYAGRLFDYLIAHPHQLRLAVWNSLERPGRGSGPAQVADSMERKVTAVARAQSDGRITRAFGAEDLLTFVLAVTTAWTPTSATTPGGMDERALLAHRGAVVEAVRRLAYDPGSAPEAPASPNVPDGPDTPERPGTPEEPGSPTEN